VTQDPQGCGGFPRLHKRAIALGESKVVAVLREGAGVRVRLEALVHRSLGPPGEAAGTTWEQALDLCFEEASIEAQPALLPLWPRAGCLTVSGATTSLLPLQGGPPGECVLHFTGDEGELRVRGTGLTIVERGEARFAERFVGPPPQAP
jgi:hypothetical protein